MGRPQALKRKLISQLLQTQVRKCLIMRSLQIRPQQRTLAQFSAKLPKLKSRFDTDFPPTAGVAWSDNSRFAMQRLNDASKHHRGRTGLRAAGPAKVSYGGAQRLQQVLAIIRDAQRARIAWMAKARGVGNPVATGRCKRRMEAMPTDQVEDGLERVLTHIV